MNSANHRRDALPNYHGILGIIFNMCIPIRYILEQLIINQEIVGQECTSEERFHKNLLGDGGATSHPHTSERTSACSLCLPSETAFKTKIHITPSKFLLQKNQKIRRIRFRFWVGFLFWYVPNNTKQLRKNQVFPHFLSKETWQWKN